MKGMRQLNQHIDRRIMMKTSKLRTIRCLINGKAIAGSASGVQAVPLLTCDDDPDYDQAIDGTTAAEVQPHTAIVNIKLAVTFSGFDNAAMTRWILFKDPDNILGTTQSPDDLFIQDITANDIVLRKNTLKAGYFVPSTGFDKPTAPLHIRRKALSRIGDMEDGDKLRFNMIAGGTTAGKMFAMGTITVREK